MRCDLITKETDDSVKSGKSGLCLQHLLAVGQRAQAAAASFRIFFVHSSVRVT